MNDGSAEAMQEWVDREQLPFAILRDPDRAVATAYGIAQPDAPRYVANNAEGRRPGILVDEQGRVAAIMPDLRSVEDQMEALARLT